MPSPTIAPKPMEAQTGTRSITRTMNTIIIESDAMSGPRPDESRGRLPLFGTAGQGPRHVDDFGDDDIAGPDEKRNIEEGFRPLQNIGLEHRNDLQRPEREHKHDRLEDDGRE